MPEHVPSAGLNGDPEIESLTSFVTKYDADFRDGEAKWEQRFEQIKVSVVEGLPVPPDAKSRQYWTLVITGNTAKAALVIRQFVTYRAVTVLDVLAATFVLKQFGEAWTALRGEVRLQRRARGHLKLSGADDETRRAAILELRARLGQVLIGFRGSIRSVMVAALVTIVPLGVISALVAKTILLLTASLLFGWTISPVLSALLLLAVVRPLFYKISDKYLRTRCDRLLINWMRLVAFSMESEIRVHYFERQMQLHRDRAAAHGAGPEQP